MHVPSSRRRFLRNAALTSAGLAAMRSAFGQMRGGAETPVPGATAIATSPAGKWQPLTVTGSRFRWDLLNLNIDLKATAQTMQGFGGCFNELGWVALSAMRPDARKAMMRELFHPTEGMRFTYCRMPIGANDFARDAYSYDETDGDFALEHFSIAHDRDSLIPFIHAAQEQQPALKVWASPWTPPSWMKRNHFYAEARGRGGMKDNGIREDQIGHEGEDMFLLDEAHLKAYAKYFGKFIDAYRAEGIHVGMVMPQNEFNSAQNFPSCTWTPEGLAKFIRYLGPEMSARQVEIFFGTLERGDPRMLQTVLDDPQAGKFIRGVGTQWAGKNALPEIARKHPNLTIFQSEQECGDGKNTWEYTGYCWQLMKHYLRSGASGYMYWNIATPEGGLSSWGWAQNALVCVDPQSGTPTLNPDFYLMKHLSHFVEVGAVRLETTGTCDDAVAFRNPDGTLIVLVRNELAHPQSVQIAAGQSPVAVMLPPDSISTISLKV